MWFHAPYESCPQMLHVSYCNILQIERAKVTVKYLKYYADNSLVSEPCAVRRALAMERK
jgi:hypothetical protein